MTMSLIETVEVGAGGAASIEFTSIPQDGTDLVLLVSARGGDDNMDFSINNNTNGIYDQAVLRGFVESSANAATVTDDSAAAQNYISRTADTANTFGSSQFYFFNYTSSSAKSVSSESVQENDAEFAGTGLNAHSIDDTNPITSIKLFLPSDDLLEYSTASLYKITAA